MNFFADESLDRQITVRLRQGGHAVLDVTEMDPGISDDKVLSMANESKFLSSMSCHPAISLNCPFWAPNWMFKTELLKIHWLFCKVNRLPWSDARRR
jgi:hypothetical protein